MSDLTLITPTGDRPEMFALCERWMARQDFQGSVQWIVVDDGAIPTQCTAGQEYVRVERELHPSVITKANHTLGDNLARALPLVKSSKVLIIEDDDYYGKHYLRTFSGLLDQAELVGEAGSKYYRLDNWTWQWLNNRQFLHEAALARTGFRSSLIPAVMECCQGDSAVDSRLWATSTSKKLLSPSNSGLHISIKGGPGRIGYTHSRRLNHQDAGYKKLLEWTGGDAEVVAAYRQVRQSASKTSLSVIVPTIGRVSFGRTLISIARQRLTARDEVVVVADMPNGKMAKQIFENSKLPGSFLSTGDRHRDFGATPRTLGQEAATGDYLLWMDDDDVYTPNAFDVIRRNCEAHSGSFFIYRMRRNDPVKPLIWHTLEAGVIPGNVGTPMFVCPRDAVLGSWGIGRKKGRADYDFISSTIAANPDRQVLWMPDVICHVEPLGNL